ncbi:DUF4326 domain-containing protein [Micromonospora sp. WMMA1363]|uniref:DUF4326 domain-containing protein n=1 Tax=Micromonospora sp. WMMA1363 TaxID=3053985 RepID=UPI00259CBA47|nr:DUF4326 domain-containing protein [Micromonospora sp. WMMA1363]MDM4721347.1 DUF4326 domain-containing protein [Micromonospora sp. WMMA1363]
MNPHRIQRRRTAGWRMPPNTVYVGRPTKWGNRFGADATSASRTGAVRLFRLWVAEHPDYAGAARAELAGKNLACWCPLDKPCHADVLLTIANPPKENDVTTAPLDPIRPRPDMPADLTPATILRHAARYLELHGWTRNTPDEHTSYPPSRTLDAITIAVYGYPATITDRRNSDPDTAALRDDTIHCLTYFLWQDGRVPEGDYMGALCCSDTEIVSNWNNHTAQTLTDVLDTLHACADDYDRTHITEDQPDICAVVSTTQAA